MLMWVFGKWIFDAGEIPQQYIASVSDITPLVIFASLFSTTGLLVIGVLGAWAVFLGIFRLRNNGNFFGAQNSNEAFFYPMRLVGAMMLCAPVVTVGSAGGQGITLTPAHSLIAGIAKNASQAGDYIQSESFRLMHRFNMFEEPDFKYKPDREKVRQQTINWYSVAVQIGADHRKKNPYNVYSGASASTIATELIEAKWRDTYKHGSFSLSGETNQYIQKLVDAYEIPLIAPNDAMAKSGAYNSGSDYVTNSTVDGTVETDMASEGLFCPWSEFTCSDEYKSTRAQNDGAIRAGIARAQREVWLGLVAMSLSRVDSTLGAPDDHTNTGLSETAMSAFNKSESGYISELSKWYATTISRIVRETIAAEHVASAEIVYREMESWGWMAGSSFVLRAASDFSRLQSYAEGATSNLMPKSELSTLTSGDTMTKIAHDSAIKNVGKLRDDGEEPLFQKIFSTDFLKNPEDLNLSVITSWGRAMAGTGIGIVGGSYLAGMASKVFKPLAMLDNSIIKGIGVTLIIAGALIGYVLPIIFVIYGIFGVISWLTFVISSFYGVTLWAAAQAAPKGEEHSSQMAAKGWNILVFIGLYPMLAAGGLAAAVVITNVGLPFVGVMIGGMFGMLDPGTAELGKPLESLAGVLIGGLMLAVVFAVLCWSVCVTAAQLITNFPRTVLNMISLGEPALNPYENVSQGVAANIGSTIQRVGTNAVTGQAHRGISRLVGGSLRGQEQKASGK